MNGLPKTLKNLANQNTPFRFSNHEREEKEKEEKNACCCPIFSPPFFRDTKSENWKTGSSLSTDKCFSFLLSAEIVITMASFSFPVRERRIYCRCVEKMSPNVYHRWTKS